MYLLNKESLIMKNKLTFLSAIVLGSILISFGGAVFCPAGAVNVPKKIQTTKIQTKKVQSAPKLNSTSVSASGPNVPQKVREIPKQTQEEYQEQLEKEERLRILREYWEILYGNSR